MGLYGAGKSAIIVKKLDRSWNLIKIIFFIDFWIVKIVFSKNFYIKIDFNRFFTPKSILINFWYFLTPKTSFPQISSPHLILKDFLLQNQHGSRFDTKFHFYRFFTLKSISNNFWYLLTRKIKFHRIFTDFLLQN